MLDPELFIRPDGLPMAFMMTYKGLQTKKVKQLVEERGGVVLEQPSLLYRDNMVRLLVGGEVSLRRDLDMFDYRYVLDCVKEDMILPNMLDYRINSHLPSIHQQYDPVGVDVLLGYKRWKDIPEAEGEKVSDIEEDFYVADPPGSDTQSKNVFKSFRIPYSKKHQHEIVQFLVSHSAYKMVKGNSIWQRMEEGGLCKGARTWQSMKEHFRKKIIPQIHSFDLSWRQVRRFRAAFGLDQEHESDQEDDEEDDEGVEMKRNESEKSKERINQFKPRRTSSPLDTPDRIMENSHSENNNGATAIGSAEEEMEITKEVEEVAAMKRKRKLFSGDVSYFDPETEGEESVFNVTPVKKRRVINEIVELGEDDEVMEMIQVDDLDTAVISSPNASGDKVHLDEAVSIGDDENGLEEIHNLTTTGEDKTYTVAHPLAISSKHIPTENDFQDVDTTDDKVACHGTSDLTCMEATENHAETLDDIFGVEEVELLPAKRKSVSKISQTLQDNASLENIQQPASPIDTSNFQSQAGLLDIAYNLQVHSSLINSAENLQAQSGFVKYAKNLKSQAGLEESPAKSILPSARQETSSRSEYVMDSSTSTLDSNKSTCSSLKYLSSDPSNDGSPSHLKNVSRSTFPFMDVSRSISHLKDVSRCISPMKNKSRSTSPLKGVSRSISPQKDMSRSTSPLKNNSRSATPLQDVSRSTTSPLKDVSRSTSTIKHNSRSTSPMKYAKSVKVQLRKLVLHSPHSLCCRGINSVTGRKVRQGVVDARDDEDEEDEDTNDDSTDADHIDSPASVPTGHEESTNNTKAESAKKNAEREFWYASRYRQPYSRGEEEAVVNYLLRNGGYSVRGGNAVWKKMEEDWICPGRTWQSLRERFDKNIDKNLKQFGVSKTQLEKVDRKMEVSSMEGRERKKARGFRQNANYYSKEEDLNILKFIVQNKRFEDLRGIEVWQVMEERKVVKGRSWQSMKERFRKVISARIKSYGLGAEIVKEFGGVGGKKKEKRMAKNS